MHVGGGKCVRACVCEGGGQWMGDSQKLNKSRLA